MEVEHHEHAGALSLRECGDGWFNLYQPVYTQKGLHLYYGEYALYVHYNNNGAPLAKSVFYLLLTVNFQLAGSLQRFECFIHCDFYYCLGHGTL
jgi:hypothetical protein